MDYETKLNVLTGFVGHRFYILDALNPTIEQQNEYRKDEYTDNIEPPRLYRRVIYLSQAAMPDRTKLS